MTGKVLYGRYADRVHTRSQASRFALAVARIGRQRDERAVNAHHGIVIPIGNPVMTHRFAQRLLRRTLVCRR